MTINIAIISQFRAELLKKCLNSISKQTVLPKAVIVVLNSQDQSSIKLLSQYNHLKFKIKFHSKKGYAPLRNLALKTSKSDFIYFVDDDCVLDSKTVKFAYNYLLNHKDYAAVQGRSINYDTSFYAQFAKWTNDLWLERLYDKKSKTLKAIDTKNVCFRRKKIENLKFNECFGSEDVDFGLQIANRGGKIGFEPKMFVHHQEQANNLFFYCRKRLRMRKGLAMVKKKWGRLSIFYEGDRQFKQKISKLFKKSKYQRSFKHKFIFNLFLFFRDLRFFLEEENPVFKRSAAN